MPTGSLRLLQASGIEATRHVYERERPNGTVLESAPWWLRGPQIRSNGSPLLNGPALAHGPPAQECKRSTLSGLSRPKPWWPPWNRGCVYRRAS